MKIEYPNLDFLRSVAVTLVVAGHVLSFYGINGMFGMWGSLGVSLFFVHTALVLMQSLAHQLGGPGFIPFMIRRCFRIYPLAIFATLAVTAFHVPEAAIAHRHVTTWKYDWIDLIANLALVQRLASATSSIIGPFWSLSYEMQMYAVLPLFFALLNRRKWGMVLAAYATVWIVSFAACRHFALPTIFDYSPCFMAGIAAYFLLRGWRLPRLSSFLWPTYLLALAGLFLIRAVIWHVPALWWTTCALVGLSIPAFAQINYDPLVHASKIIAKYSYGIYVAHVFCVWAVLERMHWLPVPIALIVFAGLLAGISVGLYHGIEEPFIEMGKRVAAEYVGGRLMRQTEKLRLAQPSQAASALQREAIENQPARGSRTFEQSPIVQACRVAIARPDGMKTCQHRPSCRVKPTS